MKKLLLGALLLLSMTTFAQLGTDDDTGGLECEDTPAAPIDSYVYFLALIGSAYAITTITLRKNSNK
jgi:hypothetical protein